jgi:ATP-dependent DNA helicase RecQ
MRVLIAAKTRRGAGACVGGITRDGKSVRLVAANAETNDRAGLEYNVGEVWEIESSPDPRIVPPHVENIIVRSARRVDRVENIEPIVERFMPPVCGGPENLFEGRLQSMASGALYIAERTGLPSRSTMFWRPDRPLTMDVEGKRIRYRYPTADGGRTLTFVGFQEPVESIPAGTLLRVSLAHWWRPQDRPEEELRCHAQLSGWFLPGESSAPVAINPAATATPRESVVDLTRARQVLKQTFGFSEFLPLQEKVVARILHRLDTLVIMPTGGGKSLCYQLPALLFNGLTVVVSPLVALMQDQVSQLHQLGVGAAFLNHMVGHHDYVTIAGRVRGGEVRLLYVAPETLLRPETLVLLDQSRLACLAVDEAHCISEWGHDFRPEYRQLEQARRRFARAVCVALTATATTRVRQDIRRLLGIEAAGEFAASFNRPNLFLSVRPRRDALGQTLAFLEQHRGEAGIIYCATKKQVDELAAELSARGWPAFPYHAGLENETRRRNQEQFLRADAAVMVATVAFGMGINKSNVRFVLHYNLPKDIESYYQEIGRAGRDGLPANCLLLHSRADAITIRRFIDDGAESERAGRQARLEAMIRFAETGGCRRGLLLAYFDETHHAPCGQCDHCLAEQQPGAEMDASDAARKFLTCVQCTGGCFGTGQIIDVLRGSRSKRVLERHHDRLPSYSAGREFGAEEWRELARQFIEHGLLDQDVQFGGIRLTAKGRRVLAGEKVFVRRKTAVERPGVPQSAAAEHDRDLFDLLRQKRRELADRAGVPAYVIFSDRALVEMAKHLPQTPEQFLAINGVGAAKLANYGEAFLQIIRDYGAARTAPHRPPPLPPETEPTRWLTTKRRFEEVGEAFASGCSIDELEARFACKRGTIFQNLQRYCDSGSRIDAARLLQASALSFAERERVLSEFKRLGCERLAPIHEALDGRVPYEELHLLRLWLKCQTAII